MEVALYGNTHGQSYRDDVNMFLHHTPVDEMDPIRVALTAERAGIHSVWYPDHVCMPYDSESFHTANVSGQRAYQRRHNMLDAAVVMGAVASSDHDAEARDQRAHRALSPSRSRTRASS